MDDEEEMDWETSYVDEVKKMWFDTLPQSPSLPSNSRISTIVNQKSEVFIVPDTNIWIGCSDLIKTLLSTEFIKGSLPTIIIPWMVLQELDLKKGNSQRGQKQLQSATRFMHDLLLKKHPRVIGQRASEAASSEKKFEPKNADDQILLCALQCSDRNPNALVVFVTNDVNLLNKALIETISDKTTIEKRDLVLVSDSKSVLAKINERIPNLTDSQTSQRHIRVPSKRRHKCTLENINEKISQQPQPPSLINSPKRTSLKRSRETNIEKQPSCPVKDSSTVTVPTKKKCRDWTEIPKCETFGGVLKLLEDTFSHVIESKMKEDFGDIWLYTLKVKPPWTVRTAIKCIILHWIAVFSYVFGSKALVHAEGLQELLKEYNGNVSKLSSKPEDLKQCEEDIAEMAISLLNAGKLNKSSSTEAEMLICRQALLDYLKRHKL